MSTRFSRLRAALTLPLVVVCAACVNEAGAPNKPGALHKPEEVRAPAGSAPGDAGTGSERIAELEQIAEIERSGSWIPGLALAESGIREKAGDYAGAAVAAYKELSRAYGSGAAAKEQVAEGLQNALAFLSEVSPAEDAAQVEDPARSSGITALEGCAAFNREDWAKAGELLSTVLQADEEPDSFLRWMLLVCALERRKENPEAFRAARSAYGAIRARYRSFPEYWYRGARAFSKDESIAAAFAEQCIDAGPRGPFAAECRKILAAHLGISPDAAGNKTDPRLDIRSRAEIENILRASVSVNDPSALEELFPLIALPDNPYTLYALGAMKPLASVPGYRSFFLEGALKFSGRLGERLNFLARG